MTIPYRLEVLYDRSGQGFQAYNIPWAIPCHVYCSRSTSLQDHQDIEFYTQNDRDFAFGRERHNVITAHPKMVFYWGAYGGEVRVGTFAIVVLWDTETATHHYVSSEYPELQIYPSLYNRSLASLAQTLYNERSGSTAKQRTRNFRGLFHAIGEIMPCHATAVAEAESALAIHLRREAAMR